MQGMDFPRGDHQLSGEQNPLDFSLSPSTCSSAVFLGSSSMFTLTSVVEAMFIQSGSKSLVSKASVSLDLINTAVHVLQVLFYELFSLVTSPRHFTVCVCLGICFQTVTRG